MNSNRKPKIAKIPDIALRGPPVTRQVSLPPIVSVKYLAEVCGVSVDILSTQIGYSVDRSVTFQVAAGILRKYGIDVTIAAA